MGKGLWLLVVLAVLVPCTPPAVAAGSDEGAEKLRTECAYGITLAFSSKLDRAEEVFTSLLSHSPGDPRALNNLGNLYLLRGEADVALAFYTRAFAGDSEDPGILLNRAQVFEIQGDLDAARTEAAHAIALAGDPGAAADLLGLGLHPAAGDKGADKTRMSKERMLALLESALEQVPDSVSVPDSTSTTTHKKTGPSWRSAGPRGSDATDAQPVLYWKR